MNILIVHPCKGFYGGAEEVVARLYDYLEAEKHDVLVVTKNAPIGEFTRGKKLYNATSWTDFAKRVQKKTKWADAILCFNFPATLATLDCKKSVVWYCNEPPELFTSLWRKPLEALNRYWVKKSGMKCIVATPYDAKRFERIYKVKPDVVSYGIDYDFWSKGERVKRTVNRNGRAYYDKTVRLLQVGTISPLKNQAWSIRTLKELRSRGVDASLTLIGKYNEPYFLSLYNLIKELHLEEDITFAGQKTQLEVREAYFIHDILLHPVLGQGGWLVPLEAWCTNISVITIPEFQMSSLFDYVALNEKEAADMVVSITETGSKQMNGLWIKDELSWDKFGESISKVLKEQCA